MAEDLNTRVSVSEALMTDLKKTVDGINTKMDRFEDATRKDFTEADKRLSETIVIQQNQEQTILELANNINALTQNVSEISKITVELNGTRKSLDILTEDIKDVRQRLDNYNSKLNELEDKQRSERELRKERTKLKYGIATAVITAVAGVITAIVTAVL